MTAICKYLWLWYTGNIYAMVGLWTLPCELKSPSLGGLAASRSAWSTAKSTEVRKHQSCVFYCSVLKFYLTVLSDLLGKPAGQPKPSWTAGHNSTFPCYIALQEFNNNFYRMSSFRGNWVSMHCLIDKNKTISLVWYNIRRSGCPFLFWK